MEDSLFHLTINDGVSSRFSLAAFWRLMKKHK